MKTFFAAFAMNKEPEVYEHDGTKDLSLYTPHLVQGKTIAAICFNRTLFDEIALVFDDEDLESAKAWLKESQQAVQDLFDEE